MNLNELAREVTIREGGKTNLSIGQVKEVIKIICIEMFKNPLVIAKMIKSGERNHK